MASANIISICNRALLALGNQSQISSLSEQSPQANALNTLFQSTYEELARTAFWECLHYQQNLTLLAAARGTPENPNGTTLPLPPLPYSYQYAYPVNCLQMRQILPNITAPSAGVPIFSVATGSPLSIPGVRAIPYIVAYNTDANGNPLKVILTNLDNAIGVYTVNQPNPQIWDSSFQAAMVASLAAYLVPALTLHMPLMQAQIAIANRLIMEARARDGNESPHTQSRTASWIAARAGSSGWAGNSYGNDGLYNGGYCNMSWGG